MTPEQDARLRFRQWLIDHDLEPEVAYAILESMPPFDWSEIARREEMLLRFSDVDQRFDAVDQRFDGLVERFDGLAAGVSAQIDGLTANIHALVSNNDGLRSSVEGQLLAMEGRLSLRWMQTTRLIVIAMVTLFLGFVGVAVGLL